MRTDCWSHVYMSLDNHQPASFRVTCSQGIEVVVGFLDRNYRLKLVATKIPHDIGLVLILFSGQKFLTQRCRTSIGSCSTNSKRYALNRVDKGPEIALSSLLFCLYLFNTLTDTHTGLYKTNSMNYGTPTFNAAFKRALLQSLFWTESIQFLLSVLTKLFSKIYYNIDLGRPRRSWDDNIRMDLEQIGISAGNWIGSAQDRDYWRALVNVALNLRYP